MQKRPFNTLLAVVLGIVGILVFYVVGGYILNAQDRPEEDVSMRVVPY